MALTTTRRQLFRADPRGRRQPVPPPWATTRFHDDCTRCLDCLPVCPEQILVTSDGGFPAIDFKHGECTFCGDCVTACKPAALQRKQPDAPPWSHVALVDPECIEATGVHCRACVDPCPHEAVAFLPGAARGDLPMIDTVSCTGCGACVAPCPVEAIRIGTLPQSSTEVAA